MGTSGQTVSPKVYMACGISGSFRHMGGIKSFPFIVALSKNPQGSDFPACGCGRSH
ncbi:MAG: FAD-binding protein [Desulfobacterales bacterium]